MNDTLKSIVAVFSFIVLVLAITWAIAGNEFFLYRYFAPKREAVRRQVFENTKSFNQGTIQELRNHQIEYLRAPTNAQPALATAILQQIADYPDSKLPVDLQTFVQSLRSKQTLENLH
jgi:hypothetical protein